MTPYQNSVRQYDVDAALQEVMLLERPAHEVSTRAVALATWRWRKTYEPLENARRLDLYRAAHLKRGDTP